MPYLILAGIVALEIVYDQEAGCRKAPDVTHPRAVRITGIDLINSPVICGFPFQGTGIIVLISQRLGTFILGGGLDCVSYGLFISAEVDFVRSGGISRSPIEFGCLPDIDRTAARSRTACLDGQCQCRLRNKLFGRDRKSVV